MAVVNVTLQEVIENFQSISDWEDKYMYIIDIGKRLYSFDDRKKTPENLVEGCVSRVWVDAIFDGKNLELRADSDSQIVKGLIAIVVLVFSGKTPTGILTTEIEPVFQKLDLMQHLSGNRANGIRSMVKKVRGLARQYTLQK